jgi:hypothetical protein
VHFRFVWNRRRSNLFYVRITAQNGVFDVVINQGSSFGLQELPALPESPSIFGAYNWPPQIIQGLYILSCCWFASIHGPEWATCVMVRLFAWGWFSATSSCQCSMPLKSIMLRCTGFCRQISSSSPQSRQTIDDGSMPWHETSSSMISPHSSWLPIQISSSSTASDAVSPFLASLSAWSSAILQDLWFTAFKILILHAFVEFLGCPIIAVQWVTFLFSLSKLSKWKQGKTTGYLDWDKARYCQFYRPENKNSPKGCSHLKKHFGPAHNSFHNGAQMRGAGMIWNNRNCLF